MARLAPSTRAIPGCASSFCEVHNSRLKQSFQAKINNNINNNNIIINIIILTNRIIVISNIIIITMYIAITKSNKAWVDKLNAA